MVDIETISFFYEPLNEVTNYRKLDYTFDSHLGFIEMCPENTVSSVEMAGILGYESCIVVPKVTKDGQIVCIHDDTINRTARLNSNTIENEQYVFNLTYEELLSYDFGEYKNDYFKGQTIMTVDNFFSICKEYGMRPIFSTHPALDKNKWNQVKLLLERYGLLESFTIKSFEKEILDDAFKVFGHSIRGYTGDNFTVEKMNKFVQENSVSKDNVELCIEVQIDSLDRQTIKRIKDNGFRAFAFTLNSNYSEMALRDLISMGIEGFTDDTYCQQGMLFLNF